MNVLIVYFSATGNTQKIASIVGAAFTSMGAAIKLWDITPLASRRKTPDFDPYDAIIFGAPIHSWRAPRLVREWMKTLNGRGKKCSMFFTYGGFGVHPTHFSTKQILENQNFAVVSSAEFLGFHTFNLGGWKAMEGRPDASDFKLAQEYARLTYKRFSGEDSGKLGELEKTKHTEAELDSIESFRFNVLTQVPTREGQECCMCMVCEELCPSGAMLAETGKADQSKCIACLSCVANCPEKALKINDMSPSWSFKLAMEKISIEDMKAKTGKIYL